MNTIEPVWPEQDTNFPAKYVKEFAKLHCVGYPYKIHLPLKNSVPRTIEAVLVLNALGGPKKYWYFRGVSMIYLLFNPPIIQYNTI